MGGAGVFIPERIRAVRFAEENAFAGHNMGMILFIGGGVWVAASGAACAAEFFFFAGTGGVFGAHSEGGADFFHHGGEVGQSSVWIQWMIDADSRWHVLNIWEDDCERKYDEE